MDFLATWQRWCPDPSVTAVRLADRAMGDRVSGDCAWWARYGAVFGVVAINDAVSGRGPQHTLQLAAEVRLLVSVALAVGEA